MHRRLSVRAVAHELAEAGPFGVHRRLSMRAVALGHSLLTAAPHSEQPLLPKQITGVSDSGNTALALCGEEAGEKFLLQSPRRAQFDCSFDSGFCSDVETDGNSIR